MPIHPQRTFDLPDSMVGSALRTSRSSSGFELRDAAQLAGLDWRVLSRIERGERPCRVTELVALSHAYGVAPDLMLRAATGDEKSLGRLERIRRRVSRPG